MSSDRQADRFADIVFNIDRLRDHLGRLEGQPLSSNDLINDAVERCLARISEAVSVLMRMGRDLSELDPGIPWRRIHDFGNVLRHAYPDIDPDTVTVIVERHLEALRAVAASEVERLDREADL